MLAAVGYRLVVLLARDSQAGYVRERKFSLTLLMISAALCFGVSLVRPTWALLAYALNLGESPIARVLAPRGPPGTASSP